MCFCLLVYHFLILMSVVVFLFLILMLNGSDAVVIKPDERSPCKIREEVSARAALQTLDYPTLENQPESLIYEIISLISIDDSIVKLTRNRKPNNLYLHPTRDSFFPRIFS